jgi:hypothetical protein
MMIGVLGSLAEYERELHQGTHCVEAGAGVIPRQRHQVRAPHVRSTTPMPPRHAASGRRASRPPTSRKCWESPAPPCTATWQTRLPDACEETPSWKSPECGNPRPTRGAAARGRFKFAVGTLRLTCSRPVPHRAARSPTVEALVEQLAIPPDGSAGWPQPHPRCRR